MAKGLKISQNKNQLRAVGFCAFFVISLQLIGQDEKTLWFHHLHSLPNFSSSFNYYVYHDSEGFVWISSTAGLNRFDGTRVKHYISIPGDTTSLFEDNIQSTFYEDKRKNLWFSTSSAIHCYDRRKDNFQRFFIRDSNHVVLTESYAFFLEKDTFLWVKASNAIYRFNIHQPHEISFVDTANVGNWYRVDTTLDGSVRFLYPTGKLLKNKHQYWEISGEKVKSRKTWFQHAAKSSWPESVYDLFWENDTLTWIGTDKGLLAWNPQSGTIRKIRQAPSETCHFVPWKNNYLIVWAYDSGLLLFDRREEKFTPIAMRVIDGTAVPPQSFFDIYLDKEENLWLSFFNNGLIYANLNKTKFQAQPKIPVPSDGSSTYAYWAFLEDANENFWYGTDLNGLFLLDRRGKLMRHYQSNPDRPLSLKDNWIRAITQDNKKRLWVGNEAGISWLDISQDKFHLLTGGQVADSLNIYDIFRLRNGLILATAIETGILAIKEKRGNPVLERYLNSKEPYIAIFEDRSGHIYASRNEQEIEIFQLRKDSLLRIGSIPHRGFVTGYYESKDEKTLWVGSFTGLVKINKNKNWKIDTVYTEKDGLPDKNIHSLLADNAENLWLGTAKGLVLFQMQDETFRQFSMADGIQSQEFSLRSACKRRNGELWFGGSKGITIVRPGDIRYLETPPKVKVTGIKINDLEASGLQCEETEGFNISEFRSIHLPYSDNTISFEFVAIEYSDPSGNQLMYKMENVDKNWVLLEKGASGFARYPNLHEGNYTFLVKGANSDGIWNDLHTVLKIRIDPPFYRTWWFLSMVGLIVAGLTWSAIRYRIAQIKEKAELNTRIAENRMAALRAQMNPHFVFNSLQTVNGLITRQDLRGAIEYVNQFARLMRVILENSRTGIISLEKEIELLELYMKIEARRFSIPFTYNITVGENLDTFGIELPPMLLQPFVENAIKHGLFHKKEPGHIHIGFVEEDHVLICYVEDNGVGRKKSAELNTQKGRTHTSRGLEIVNERLAIIRASHPGDYKVKIIDLYDLHQNPMGTRVEITLPLQ